MNILTFYIYNTYTKWKNGYLKIIQAYADKRTKIAAANNNTYDCMTHCMTKCTD